MPTADDTHNTPLDLMSREVPDSALGPQLTEDERKQRQIGLMQKAVRALNDIDEKLLMVERALGSNLPDVLRMLALGDAVDLISDLHTVIKRIAGDGGSASAVNKRLSYAKEVTMPELLEDAKVTTFNTERFRVTKITGVMASIKGDYGVHTEGEFAGQPKSWDWLRENGYESLIKPTVNASSLSAVAKELLESGRELPDDQFNVHTKKSISVTKKR